MNTQLSGQSLSSASLEHDEDNIRAINPSDGASLDPAYRGITESSVEAVANLAESAFAAYQTLSGKDRATFLRAIAINIEAVVEDLVERTCQETALPEARVRGESARTVGQLRLFADLAESGQWVDARLETAIPDRQPLPKPDIRSQREPLGPVVVFCASNFPLAFSVAGGDTAAALAAGCPVIVKAHHSHPGTAEIIGQAIQKAASETQMPDGVFSLVYGSGRTVGTALVKHPAVKAVGFTGSQAGGVALMKAAADREEPIPVYAEMSSVNPVVIFQDKLEKDMDAIVTGLHGSVILGAGQFCTNPGLVFIPSGEAAKTFASKLAETMAETPDGTLLNSGIADAYRSAIQDRDGATALAGADKVDASTGCQVPAILLQTTAEALIANPALANEAFGPSTTLVTWSSKEELCTALSSLEGQLTGTVHATESDLEGAETVIATLRQKVGRLIYGGYPTGVEVCHSMVHGGPFPATSDGRSTSVGTMAIERFARPVCYQNAPEAFLPDALKKGNPLNLQRLVNGVMTTDSIS